MIKNEYIWLDIVGDIPKEALFKFKSIYINEYRIYLATFSQSEFRKVLIQNNILISENVFQNMTNLKVKEFSIKISQELKMERVETISILQEEYPKRLGKYEKSPTVIYLRLNKKYNSYEGLGLRKEFSNMYKLYMLEGKNEFNKEILDYVWPETISKGKNKYRASNVSNIEYGDTKKIKIKGAQYTEICKVGDIEVHILNKENRDIDKEKLIISIIDGIVVARVSNIQKGIDLVDYALEQGIGVFAVPGNILYKENYLANHIIKQGAYVVTNRYDMRNLI